MPFSDYLLYRLSRIWKSPVADMAARVGAEPGTDDYYRQYAAFQFNQRVTKGIGTSVDNLDVLEVGCGHGGITSFLAVAGARRVVGIDINTVNLEHARRFAEHVRARFGENARFPVEFLEMNAYAMTFEPESFDVVICDNSFEHFMNPEEVMRQSFHILRPGGLLLVPSFSSIYSQHGLHLKNGLKVPWANLFFSEATIVRTMRRLAADNPTLLDIYPGLADGAETVRDLRRYKDLNDITFAKFKEMAARTGFKVASFRPFPTRIGHVVQRTPGIRNTLLADIFSQGAKASLRKPSNQES